MADNTEDFEPTDGARGEDAGRDGAFDEMLSRAEADYDAESGAGERGSPVARSLPAMRRLTARRMERTAKRRTRENPQPV